MPILTTVFVLILVIALFARRGQDKYAKDRDDFWERERRANFTRKQPLDDLDYIRIPLESLPMDVCTDDPRIAEFTEIVRDLSETEIVNLTGQSNTDLKLKYGAANIIALSRFDQRYTVLASTLQRWADRLMEFGEKDAAKQVLEFAVQTGTDVSGTYKLLADIYDSEGDPASVLELIPVAEKLNTPMKDHILDILKNRK